MVDAGTERDLLPRVVAIDPDLVCVRPELSLVAVSRRETRDHERASRIRRLVGWNGLNQTSGDVARFGQQKQANLRDMRASRDVNEIFLLLGIEFFQEVNGELKPLFNKAFNVLAVVKVSTP